MQIVENLHAFVWESTTTNNCNTYFIDGPTRVLIDPGHAHLFDLVQNGLDALDVALDDIDLVICTHPHPDHIEAVRFFKDRPAKTALYEEAWQVIQGMASHLKAAMGIELDDIAPDILLREGELNAAKIEFQVIYTPGHAPGSACIYWPAKKALFSGDVIFKQGLGRTDLPGGDGARLKESIRRLAELDVDYLLSGHGEVVAGKGAVDANFKEVIETWFNYI
jgi:hydroxyacylglutathione hydrolase